MEIRIDDITYEFQQSSFFEANRQLKTLTALMKGCFTMQDGKTGFDVGELISNIGSESFANVEKFILHHLTATDENGEKVLFNKPEEINKFFNKHRSHYYQVIFEGLKFHFLGFLPSGLESKISTLNLEEVAGKVM
ncbi:phage tail assembly chaperone [Ignatzschineria larvae DSM 13226]|uniref:Phage tail assembly chaperone n=1 Tax=Ignatzschineria larvae DSM 13226 TaxID=1111732 RepID=A0ABZ3BYZ8_9GAMM|nr:putative phage tail assembly chaperone [Ignatzschineria larvae]